MKLKSLLPSAVVFGLLAGTVQATPIDYQSGTKYIAQQVIDLSTGADLAGLEVTACFLDQSCQMVSFARDLSKPAAGVALGDDWKLSLSGDSYANRFFFSTDIPVTLLHLNGAGSNTVFDTKAFRDETPGTPGSSLGSYFTHSTGIQPTQVTYSNEVWLGDTFYGDLYTSMSIFFGSEGAVGQMRFFADTDQVVGLQVPAPATLLLMLAGLMALRQRKST